MADLIVKGLERQFGSFTAVKAIDFTAHDGEFVTLLGPSGCGKSTTLWMIAGLDRPSAGRIELSEETIADVATGRYVPAENRDFGLVFQSYALWPHMTVRENLAFPLKLRGLDKKQRDERIEEALALVELVGQADKYPFQLSGGQQQRVALARTLVYRPRLLLLDEPLSNLDAKLRERARVWLRDLQRRLGVTTLYVTHDQSEALAMSDRILVMREGEIVQDATPETIYRHPTDSFVADFIGSSNFLSGRVDSDGSGVVLENGARIAVRPPPGTGAGEPVTAAFRPETTRLLADRETAGPAETVLEAKVHLVSYLGAHYQVVVEVGDTTLRVETDTAPEAGTVRVAIPDTTWMLFAGGARDTRKDEISDHAH